MSSISYLGVGGHTERCIGAGHNTQSAHKSLSNREKKSNDQHNPCTSTICRVEGHPRQNEHLLYLPTSNGKLLSITRLRRLHRISPCGMINYCSRIKNNDYQLIGGNHGQREQALTSGVGDESGCLRYGTIVVVVRGGTWTWPDRTGKRQRHDGGNVKYLLIHYLLTYSEGYW